MNCCIGVGSAGLRDLAFGLSEIAGERKGQKIWIMWVTYPQLINLKLKQW
jgi:hypothetical protein